MTVAIETVTGLIELRDDFTSQIGLAQAALAQFSKENQESLKAVAEAAGLVTTALAAVVTATIALGKQGSEVNDVTGSLVTFAGSAQNAADVMGKLRDSTKGTVDDFTLAKDATKLLSTGVALTADQFATLGDAALLLQKRGLGDTAQQLDLVSDALVTGRTRALATELGVVDLGNAQENYAKTLGISVDTLSDYGKAEAARIQVMALLDTATKTNVETTLTFAQEVAQAKVSVTNFFDEVASNVAKSPVYAAAFDVIKDAVSDMFNGDSQAGAAAVAHSLESTADSVAGVALIFVSAARVVNTAWSAIKVVVDTVTLAAVESATDIQAAITLVASAAAKVPGASDSVKAFAATQKDVLLVNQQMVQSLKDQRAEAALGITQNSDFDKTLDGLEATIVKMKDAVDAASDSEKNFNKQSTSSGVITLYGPWQDATEAADAYAAAATKAGSPVIYGPFKTAQDVVDAYTHSVTDAANANGALANSFDVTKLLAAYDKSFNELTTITANFNAQVIKDSGTSAQGQQADIEATFTKAVDSLDRLDPLFTDKYNAFRATADEALGAIGVDWDSVKDKSITGMQQQADAALTLYNKMVLSGNFFRDDLDAQLQKYKDLQAQANGWGKAGTDANNSVTKSAKDQLMTVESISDAWDLVSKGVSAAKIQVQLLDGEMVSLADAQKKFDQGSDFTYDLSTDQGIAQYQKMNPGATFTWSTKQIEDYITKGGTLQGLIQTGVINPYGGLTGFAQGGDVDIKVGENGPEVVRVPLGSRVFANGMNPTTNNGGDTYLMTVQVNGTPEQAAKRAGTILLSKLKTRKKFAANQ